MNINNNSKIENKVNKNCFNKKFNDNLPDGKPSYAFYSRVLNKPFDSLDLLNQAEADYYAEVHAKEARAAAKKADASKVEEAFRALNAARKSYKNDLMTITSDYAETLKKLRAAFDSDKAAVQQRLANAEAAYEAALREFNEKHPEGYHLTLKDGDFETTISSRATHPEAAKFSDLFELLFKI